MPNQHNVSLSKMRRLLWLMGIIKIPLIGYVKPRLLILDDHQVQVKIKLRRRTKNHLQSMYFGSLAVGADVAAGIHAFYFAKKTGVHVSFAFKSVNGEFTQRAMTDVIFESNDGQVVENAFNRAMETKERINEPVNVIAYNTMKEEVARFNLVISIKVK
jgi:hypothetical protein